MPTYQLIEILFFLFLFSTTAFLGILFFTIKSENRKANIFLGLFLWSIAIHIYNDFLYDSFFNHYAHHIRFLFEPLLLTIPFLFFYLLATINWDIKTGYYSLFVPGIVHNLLLYSDDRVLPENGLTIYETTFYILGIVLIVIAIQILHKHQKNISDYYSDIEHKSLLWLRRLFILILVLISVSILSEGIESIGTNSETIENIILLLFMGIAIFIPFWIGYNGFSQPEIFKESLFLTPLVDDRMEQLVLHPSENANEQDPTISDEDKQHFFRIKKQITNQELYTKPKLNLRMLSEAIDLSERELSRLINECGQVNFYRFINEFRVEKFKELLQSPKAQKLSLLGLATEAGFASKSTFYAVFKAIEDMTPKQYQDAKNKSE